MTRMRRGRLRAPRWFRCSADNLRAVSTAEPQLLWEPSAEMVERSQLTAYTRWLAETRGLEFGTYDDLWRWSVENLEDFWASIWERFGVESDGSHDVVLADDSMPGAKWFPGARLNYAERALSGQARRPRGDRARLRDPRAGRAHVGRAARAGRAHPGRPGPIWAWARATAWWPTCRTCPRPWRRSSPPPPSGRSGRARRPSSARAP